MKTFWIIVFFALMFFSGKAHDTLKISEDIYLLKLSEQTYIHVSWHSDPQWGKFTCNGILVIHKNEAALFDTPMSDSLTRKLVRFIQDSLKSKITYFVPNHFHNDCTEGMDILDSLGAITVSSEKTKEISQERGIITAHKTFSDTLTLHLPGKNIFLEYPGPAHAPDNIVAWIPDEKILFGGCMIRSKETSSKGNLSDADEEEWPKTIKKLQKKYKDAEIVIPGHGNYGTGELLKHTYKIVKKKPGFRIAVPIR